MAVRGHTFEPARQAATVIREGARLGGTRGCGGGLGWNAGAGGRKLRWQLALRCPRRGHCGSVGAAQQKFGPDRPPDGEDQMIRDMALRPLREGNAEDVELDGPDSRQRGALERWDKGASGGGVGRQQSHCCFRILRGGPFLKPPHPPELPPLTSATLGTHGPAPSDGQISGNFMPRCRRIPAQATEINNISAGLNGLAS